MAVNLITDIGFNKIQEESNETKIKHLFIKNKKNTINYLNSYTNQSIPYEFDLFNDKNILNQTEILFSTKSYIFQL